MNANNSNVVLKRRTGDRVRAESRLKGGPIVAEGKPCRSPRRRGVALGIVQQKKRALKKGQARRQRTCSESFGSPLHQGEQVFAWFRGRCPRLVCPAGADSIGMRVPDGVDDGNRSRTASAEPRGTKRKGRRQTLDCRNTNRQRGREQRASRLAQAKPKSHQTEPCRA